MNNNEIKGNRQIFLCTVVPLAPTLQDIDFVRISQDIAHAAKLTTLEWQSFYYPGQGSSFHWFLGESHIQLDTYPEYHIVEITLMSCKDFEILPVIDAIKDAGLIINNFSCIHKNENNQWQHC